MTQAEDLPLGLMYTVKLVARMVEVWLTSLLPGLLAVSELWASTTTCVQDKTACDVVYMASGRGEARLHIIHGIAAGSNFTNDHKCLQETYPGQSRCICKGFATGDACHVTALALGMPALQDALQFRL